MMEIPEHDLEGNKIKNLRSINSLELPSTIRVDENFIADLRYKHKKAYMNYIRKRMVWMNTF